MKNKNSNDFVEIEIGADVKKAVQGINDVNKRLDKFTGKIKKSSKSMERAEKVSSSFGDTLSGIVGVGTVIAGFNNLNNAITEFQGAMGNVSTLVDTSSESMDEMGAKVLEIAKKTPVAINQLTSALYDVRSAGISAKDSMMVLSQSARLATTGLGTTKEAVDLSTSAINAFGFKGKEASKVFDILQLSVKSGKTTISELAQSFGMVAGVAKTAGVSFVELQSATSAITTTGLKASVAQTQLRSAILAIQAPSTAMQEVLEKIGISSGSAMLKQYGLVKSMEMIKKASGGQIEVLKKAYGSVEALGSSLSLTGAQSKIFKDTLKDMENSVGTLDNAFEKQNKTLKAQSQIMMNNLESLSISIGKSFIPTFSGATEVVGGLANIFGKIVMKEPQVSAVFIGLTSLVIGATSAMKLLGTSFRFAFLPLAGAVATITAATYAIDSLILTSRENSKAIRESKSELQKLDDEYENHKEKIKTLQEELKNNSKNLSIEEIENRKKTLETEIKLNGISLASRNKMFELMQIQSRKQLNLLMEETEQAKKAIAGTLGSWEGITMRFFGNDQQKEIEQLARTIKKAEGVKSNLRDILNKNNAGKLNLDSSDIEKYNEEIILAGVNSEKAKRSLDKIKKSLNGRREKNKSIIKFNGIDEFLNHSKQAKKQIEEIGVEEEKAGAKSKNLTAVSDELKKIQKSAQDSIMKIAGLGDKIKELKNKFNEDNKNLDESIGEKVYQQQLKIANLEKELSNEKVEEKKNELSEKLAIEKKALEDNKSLIEKFSKEISEAKRFSELTDFEKFLEKTNEKRELLQKEFDEKLEKITEEIEAEQLALDKFKEIYREKGGEIKNFGGKYSDVMRDISTSTTETADIAEKQLARISSAMAQIRGLTAPKKGRDTRTNQEVARQSGVYNSNPFSSDISSQNNTTSNTNNNSVDNSSINANINISGSENPNDLAHRVLKLLTMGRRKQKQGITT